MNTTDFKDLLIVLNFSLGIDGVQGFAESGNICLSFSSNGIEECYNMETEEDVNVSVEQERILLEELNNYINQ